MVRATCCEQVCVQRGGDDATLVGIAADALERLRRPTLLRIAADARERLRRPSSSSSRQQFEIGGGRRRQRGKAYVSQPSAIDAPMFISISANRETRNKKTDEKD